MARTDDEADLDDIEATQAWLERRARRLLKRKNALRRADLAELSALRAPSSGSARNDVIELRQAPDEAA